MIPFPGGASLRGKMRPIGMGEAAARSGVRRSDLTSALEVKLGAWVP